MRVHVVLFALVTTPFLAGAAQDAALKDAASCAVPDANRSVTSWSNNRPDARPDPFGRPRTGCAPVAPAPPTGGGGDTGGGTGGQTGTLVISGTVWDGNSWLGVGGWVIDVTGTATASAVTNADGTYGFWDLPPGTYTVCEQVKAGWTQTYPKSGSACPTGQGYTFTLTTGGSASLLDFVDIQ
jgi:SdrD B-like protein